MMTKAYPSVPLSGLLLRTLQSMPPAVLGVLIKPSISSALRWHWLSMFRSSVSSVPACVQVSDLYVADASIFPTATGVNPMITVEAMSYMVAQGLAQRFRDSRSAALPAGRMHA